MAELDDESAAETVTALLETEADGDKGSDEYETGDSGKNAEDEKDFAFGDEEAMVGVQKNICDCLVSRVRDGKSNDVFIGERVDVGDDANGEDGVKELI